MKHDISDLRNILQLQNLKLGDEFTNSKVLLASDNEYIPIHSINQATYKSKGNKKEIVYEIPVYGEYGNIRTTVKIKNIAQAFFSSHFVRKYEMSQYQYICFRGLLLCNSPLMYPSILLALCVHRDKVDATKEKKWRDAEDLVLFVDNKFHSRTHSYVWRNIHRDIIMEAAAMGVRIRFTDNIDNECAKVTCLGLEISTEIDVTERDEYISKEMTDKLYKLLSESSMMYHPTPRRRRGTATSVEIIDDTVPEQTQINTIGSGSTVWTTGIDPYRHDNGIAGAYVAGVDQYGAVNIGESLTVPAVGTTLSATVAEYTHTLDRIQELVHRQANTITEAMIRDAASIPPEQEQDISF